MNREDIPVVIVNEQGLFSYVNQAFEQAFGWDRASIIGHTLTMIIPPGFRDAHNLGFSRFLTTAKGSVLNRPLRLQAIAKDGGERNIEMTILAEKQDHEWMFGATLRPAN
ncbi:MAG: PAS domain-containing protein [Acidobacteriota bacterium]|nr:PAS domain-containing protein [Acidobacteriota bacterium]